MGASMNIHYLFRLMSLNTLSLAGGITLGGRTYKKWGLAGVSGWWWTYKPGPFPASVFSLCWLATSFFTKPQASATMYSCTVKPCAKINLYFLKLFTVQDLVLVRNALDSQLCRWHSLKYLLWARSNGDKGLWNCLSLKAFFSIIAAVSR